MLSGAGIWERPVGLRARRGSSGVSPRSTISGLLSLHVCFVERVSESKLVLTGRRRVVTPECKRRTSDTTPSLDLF